jgi:type 1 glutamine amidotransferase
MTATAVLVIGDDHLDFHRLEEKGPLFRAIFADDAVDPTITSDRGELAGPRLAGYDVVLDYTTVPPVDHVEDLRDFVRNGGGYVGIHSATDVTYGVDEPAEEVASLIGGRFHTHPEQSTIGVHILDRAHPITDDLEDFEVFDEPYDVSLEDDAEVHVLAEMDHPVLGSTPVAWVREDGDGRVYYCSLGHTDETFEDPAFQRLVRRGVRWAAGESP